MMNPKELGLSLELDPDGHGFDGVNRSGEISEDNAGPDDRSTKDPKSVIHHPEDIVDPKGLRQTTDEPSSESLGSDVVFDPGTRRVEDTEVITDPMLPKTRSRPRWGPDVDGSGTRHADNTEVVDDMIPVNDEDPKLPFGHATTSSSSSLSGSRASSVESDDEDMLDEVQQRKKAAPKQRRRRPTITRVLEAVDMAREHMICGFVKRVSRVAELLAKLGEKAKEDMLDLSEIDASLKFIKVLQGKKVSKLEDEVKRLRGQQDEIYEEQVSEVAGPSAIETIDVEGIVPEERVGNEDAE
ncbi:hypothetical protein AALP_AA4G103000 [Arabis alpina]|uniref:Uncharacterized protein n=1 Tax=Arabis alpina TaxID=50452 RepID=A0A087H2D6_ARAAL|nr:hypothetical protein AALP_AA4G103000 [Arabis alpina]